MHPQIEQRLTSSSLSFMPQHIAAEVLFEVKVREVLPCFYESANEVIKRFGNRRSAAVCSCDIPVMQAKYCPHGHMVVRWNHRSSSMVVAMMLLIESVRVEEKKYSQDLWLID